MRIKRIQLKDLTDIASFRSWLRKSVKYHERYVVTSQHLLIYLDYITDRIKEAAEITPKVWLERIAELKQRLKALND